MALLRHMKNKSSTLGRLEVVRRSDLPWRGLEGGCGGSSAVLYAV